MKKTIKQIGNEMRTLEQTVDSQLPHVGYAIIRVDGRNFHTLTRNMNRPMDEWFMEAMNNAAKRAMDSVNAIAAYVQSDEISLIIDPHNKNNCSLPFNGRVEKLVSLSASSAAVGFYEYYSERGTQAYSCLIEDRTIRSFDEFYDDYDDGEGEIDYRIKTVLDSCPQFDSRVISLETLEEVEDYLTWRRMDCMRNAVSSYALSEFSPSQLYGKSTSERWEMLSSVYGENFKIPDDFYWGRLLFKTKVKDYDKWAGFKTNDYKPGMEHDTVIMRTMMVTKPATKNTIKELISMLSAKADPFNTAENA